MTDVRHMLNFREPESKTDTPSELAMSAEQSALCVSKKTNQRPPYIFTHDSLLEQLSFEQLGLVAFDPDRLDWWSSNESA